MGLRDTCVQTATLGIQADACYKGIISAYYSGQAPEGLRPGEYYVQPAFGRPLIGIASKSATSKPGAVSWPPKFGVPGLSGLADPLGSKTPAILIGCILLGGLLTYAITRRS